MVEKYLGEYWADLLFDVTVFFFAPIVLVATWYTNWKVNREWTEWLDMDPT